MKEQRLRCANFNAPRGCVLAWIDGITFVAPALEGPCYLSDMCGRVVFCVDVIATNFFLAVGGRSYVSEICARRFAGVVCGSEERPGNLSVERFIRELVLFRIDLILIACAFRVVGCEMARRSLWVACTSGRGVRRGLPYFRERLRCTNCNVIMLFHPVRVCF